MSYTYILRCSDGSYYTGSTKNLEQRLWQHQNSKGANHTKVRLPVELMYSEYYERVDEAFVREKQIQKWSRKKKEALIEGNFEKLRCLSQSHFDKLSDRLTLEKLCDIHGLGIAKASQILASIELSKRYLIRSNRRITDAKDVYKELKSFSTKSQEHFLTITLDGASHIINTRTVFIGTLNQSLVHPREVFADAIADRAAGIIIAHNHPSGTLEASRADISITQRLKEVSKLVGIELLDHVILSKHGYYSFSDEGLL